MTHDSEYFEQRAAEARAAASRTDEMADVEGDLALAYAALARRRAKEQPAVPLDEPTA